jgi:NAD(P)-dependent dehydrogenase (short-subunit alcohol dehydrogenase family)
MDHGVCVITGGGRGIGAATARRAAAAGWTVVLSYRSDADSARRVATEIGGHAVCADVTDEGAVMELFARAGQHGSITAVVANAGIVAGPTTVAEMTVDRVRVLFEVNVIGLIVTARESVRRMAISRGGAGGSFVAVSSIASRLGSPHEYVDYAATKGAVDSFALGLAKEVAADGIRVNVVRPGIIDTEIHASGGQRDRAERVGALAPLGRAGTADEVAAAIVWMLDDDASYTTGAILDVGGGR